MKVSIIMGAYNVEKTIARSIESIINQTYKDWFFIICDDGSSDGTYSILEQYKQNYPDKFLIIKNDTNRGLTYTLNHCLKHVTSEYVARMDADDSSLPDRLNTQVEFLEANPEYAFVGSAVERFDEDGEYVVLDLLGGFEEDYSNELDRPWIAYHGHQDDIRSYIAQADCFVLPSYHEGMANANLECAASGCPIITSNIPGCRESVIDEKTGLLCEPKDEESLYQAMRKMVHTDREKRIRMGVDGRSYMSDVFDKRKVVEETIRTIEI